MSMNSRAATLMLLRYAVLLLLPLGNLVLFYAVFTPLTLYASFALVSLFEQVRLSPTLPGFTAGDTLISLIPACIAGSAYYLLTILNLSTPMSSKARVQSLGFLLGSFFLFNVLRIVFFVAIRQSSYFALAHEAVWTIGSTLFVVVLWFSSVRMWELNAIPFYTDARSLMRDRWASKQPKRFKTRAR